MIPGTASATPRHGVDGWSLEDYEWDPDTGLATMEYEHDSGRTDRRVVAHPTGPHHAGWWSKRS